MKKTLPEGKYLIKYSPWNDTTTTLTTILNVATVKGHLISYETKDGMQTKSLADLLSHNSISLIKDTDIDVESSLHYWYKNNEQHRTKPLIRKEDIVDGEIVKGKTSVISLMLSYDDTNVYYKFLYE